MIKKFMPGTCVSPEGRFVVGIHRPTFDVDLLRENDFIESLGALPDGTKVDNQVNFPGDKIEEQGADIIYEVPNPFPFRGTTYINAPWADAKSGRPETIAIPKPPAVSMGDVIKKWLVSLGHSGVAKDKNRELIGMLPRPMLLALAESTTDPQDLITIASLCCTFVPCTPLSASGDDNVVTPPLSHDPGLSPDTVVPKGLLFKKDKTGQLRPDISDHDLFEIVANNPHLPDVYKQVMVLKPGIQGSSEITGEWREDGGKSHVFEYLRRNSYIPWGHFAANTADDTVRYRIKDLTPNDMSGMRHLYYQRTYLRVAGELGLPGPSHAAPCSDVKKRMSQEELENLRRGIMARLSGNNKEHDHDSSALKLAFNSSLWGWNFGFGYAQCDYRLHASHQQIHQQYAMVPESVDTAFQNGEEQLKIPSYACGDMVAEFVRTYREQTGKNFFECYIQAIRSNCRTDGNPSLSSTLVIYEDEQVMLFVPKAQTSQWELQLMPVQPCGNILEADTAMRDSLDKAILTALHILERMGARMVTSIEYSRRFDSHDRDQRILYSFLPKIPQSPGAFSEAQLRWINGHYPEDFAEACRVQANKLT